MTFQAAIVAIAIVQYNTNISTSVSSWCGNFHL